MGRPRQTVTIGGRVSRSKVARVDAAARLVESSRSKFIIEATLTAAEQVLREASRYGESDGPRQFGHLVTELASDA